MTTRGKSALRKNRFTRYPSARVAASQASLRAPERFALGPFGNQIFAQYADVGQVPVSLREVEPVADHEPVRDLEADPADVDVDLAAGGLRHQRRDLERGRLARLEVADQVGEGEARVDDVLDDEHVPPLDVDVQVLEDPDDAGGVGGGAVARDRHEVDLARHRQVPHEIRHEEDGALQDADEQRVAARVEVRDLVTELGDPRLQRLLVDQDLADAALEVSSRRHP